MGSQLLTLVVVVALIALTDRRRATVWLGIALGALTHLWRDMGTVPLLWPFGNSVWGVRFWVYVTGTVGVGLVMTGVGMWGDRYVWDNRVWKQPSA